MTSEKQAALTVSVREATEEDIPVILRFIKDLATYEKEPDSAKATPELLSKALFSTPTFAYCLICQDQENNDKPVGFALYFYNFSTWTGRPSIYLEDLYVDPEMRNRGAGKALFRELGKIALKNQCPRIDWCVLKWNSPSIAFYKEVIGARLMDDWSMVRLEGDGISNLANLK